jgi:hypothetical protein
MENRFFEKPILNSPYEYPVEYCELDSEGRSTQRIIRRWFPKGSSKKLAPLEQGLLNWKLDLAELFHRLTYEMSRPMIADKDKSSYFSTQFLCDGVRKAGYDGIEYPSATGTGFNVVRDKIFSKEGN